jgi:hypothetical protein
VLVVLSAVICGGASSTVRAAGGEEARITVALANVRESPSTQSPIVFQARRDQSFPVIERAGDWLLIEGPAKVEGRLADLVEVQASTVRARRPFGRRSPDPPEGRPRSRHLPSPFE